MLLIKNGYIKTMAGSDIPNGCILADNGKILAVGSDLKAPEGAQIIDAGGRLVTPAVWTHTATSDLTMKRPDGREWITMRS